MTSGPATRRALHAAGTQGAATAGTIHLPAAPERSANGLGILAHELSHAADTDPRPRLFGEGLLDMGERRARGIGQAVSSAAGGARQSASSAIGSARQAAGSAIGSARQAAGSVVGGVRNEAADVAGRAGRAAQGAVGAAEGLLERPPISSLPIGGMAAAVPAAVRAAEGVMAQAGGAASSAMETAQGYAARGQAMAGQAIGDATAMAQQGWTRAQDFARGAVGAAERQAGALRGRAEDAIGDARAALGSVVQDASAVLDQSGQVDAMIEAIEQRLLAELERRGGRFQGLF